MPAKENSRAWDWALQQNIMGLINFKTYPTVLRCIFAPKGSFKFGIFTYIFSQTLVVTYVQRDWIYYPWFNLYIVTEQVFQFAKHLLNFGLEMGLCCIFHVLIYFSTYSNLHADLHRSVGNMITPGKLCFIIRIKLTYLIMFYTHQLTFLIGG